MPVTIIVIELKIWRGDAYNSRGEKQLSDYLDYFNLKKGYSDTTIADLLEVSVTMLQQWFSSTNIAKP